MYPIETFPTLFYVKFCPIVAKYTFIYYIVYGVILYTFIIYYIVSFFNLAKALLDKYIAGFDWE